MLYTDHDEKACRWIQELVNTGALLPGDVYPQGIEDITPEDVLHHEQAHFFAGIGGWPYASRLAGWRGPLWTASLPCQPFSQAGKRLGTEDRRHLWPVFRNLVAQCLPPVIVGEQVASKAGRDWLATVRTDLEALGYAVGAADLCAAGAGAPHIRQRLYWVAHRSSAGLEKRREQPARQECTPTERGGGADGLADTDGRQPRQTRARRIQPGRQHGQQPQDGSDDDGMANTVPAGRAERRSGSGARPSPWSSVIYHPCSDGKARPIPTEPSLFPLAHGVPERVVRLRGYGNAIVPQVATLFLVALNDALTG